MPVFLYQENSLAANFLISTESLEGFKRAGWSLSLLLFAQRKRFLLVFPTKLGHNEAGEVKGPSPGLVSWSSWVFGWKIRIITCSHVTTGSGRLRSTRHNSSNWHKWLESQINNSYLYFSLWEKKRLKLVIVFSFVSILISPEQNAALKIPA